MVGPGSGARSIELTPGAPAGAVACRDGGSSQRHQGGGSNSHLVLQQVRLLAAMGDRASAIKAAEGHARRLREDFDLEPDREILATIERIRRGEAPAPLSTATLPSEPLAH